MLSSPFSGPEVSPPEEEEVGGAMVENDRRTRGESSLSTCRARSAADASRSVGRGRSIVLQELVSFECKLWGMIVNGPYKEQGNSGSRGVAMTAFVLLSSSGDSGFRKDRARMNLIISGGEVTFAYFQG